MRCNVGFGLRQVDEADDEDDVKGALVAMILRHAPRPGGAAAPGDLTRLQAELAALKPRALKAHALESYVVPAASLRSTVSSALCAAC